MLLCFFQANCVSSRVSWTYIPLENATQKMRKAQYMKYNGIWTTNPTHRAMNRSKNFPLVVQVLGLWAIDWAINRRNRLTPWKVVAFQADRQTDKVRTIAYWKYAKNRLRKFFGPSPVRWEFKSQINFI
jgi:hypothetical protein